MRVVSLIFFISSHPHRTEFLPARILRGRVSPGFLLIERLDVGKWGGRMRQSQFPHHSSEQSPGLVSKSGSDRSFCRVFVVVANICRVDGSFKLRGVFLMGMGR